jgi:hypothetical protein
VWCTSCSGSSSGGGDMVSFTLASRRAGSGCDEMVRWQTRKRGGRGRWGLFNRCSKPERRSTDFQLHVLSFHDSNQNQFHFFPSLIRLQSANSRPGRRGVVRCGTGSIGRSTVAARRGTVVRPAQGRREEGVARAKMGQSTGLAT